MAKRIKPRILTAPTITIGTVGGMEVPPANPVAQPIAVTGTYATSSGTDAVYVKCVIVHPNGETYDNGVWGPFTDRTWDYDFDGVGVPATDSGQSALLSACLVDGDGNSLCSPDSVYIQIGSTPQNNAKRKKRIVKKQGPLKGRR